MATWKNVYSLTLTGERKATKGQLCERMHATQARPHYENVCIRVIGLQVLLPPAFLKYCGYILYSFIVLVYTVLKGEQKV